MTNYGLSLAVITVLSFSGCGSSGGDSSSSTSTVKNPTPTDVTVERGKVYEATVVDSENNTGTQKNGQNIYTFDDVPKYPISVTGGWIDVDNDGKKTVEDIELTTTMKSYSTNVTPITTYIADGNSSVRETKINALATKTGVSVEELMKLPSTGNTDAMLVQNSIYKQIKSNNSIDDIDIDTIKIDFDTLKNIATQNTDKNTTELLVLIEKEVVSNLVVANKINKISLENAIDMTDDEKNVYSLGVNDDDFVLSNTLANFTTLSDVNLSTGYESNEITFEGINVALSISINNNDFKIIKNGTELDVNSTTVSNTDKIKLKTTTSENFDETKSVVLSIEDKFTNVANDKLNFSSAQTLCTNQNLELPTGINLNKYYNSNNDKMNNYSEYWTSDNYSLSSFGKTYDTATNTTGGSLLSFPYGVICTKHYDSISFSITTKSDPNQAPIANAGIDQKVYHTDSVTLSASASSDDSEIVSYEWKEDSTVLSNDINFTKTDFSIGTHNLVLKVTDDGGKSTTDEVEIVIFNSFTNLLPMQENGGIKSISSSTINGTTTTTLSAGSQNFFKITNDTTREFTITKFEIVSTYNGNNTTRVSSTDITGVLGSNKLSAGQNVTLGHSLTSSETANYWTGKYYLTDDATGETFTNSITWNGTSFN
jgi:hypothetical protein